MSPLAIDISGLTHRYPAKKGSEERKALDGVSLQVPEREMFGVLGPNGGGKSTLFKILSTLIAPTEGSVKIFGEDVLLHPNRVRSLIGVVFQSPALDKKLTVEENLLAQGYLYGESGTSLKEKVKAGLERMGLWERRKEYAEKLSGGLKRRIEIAKALLHSPRLLILDEPTTGLDPGMRRELWDYLKELQGKSAMTLVVTTHLMEEADGCERIALLDRGKIVSLGAPQELRQELGGNVISIKSADPERLKVQLDEAFKSASSLNDGEIRIEKDMGPNFLTEVMGRFSNQIHSITIGKPTLEDLFLRKTGRKISDPEHSHA